MRNLKGQNVFFEKSECGDSSIVFGFTSFSSKYNHESMNSPIPSKISSALPSILDSLSSIVERAQSKVSKKAEKGFPLK